MTTKKTTTKKTTTRKPKTKKTTTTQISLSPKASGKTGAKNLSAINAAAKVLSEAKEPLTTKQMIEQMAAKGYWTSPGGKTPHATLYAALLRDIQRKSEDSRFAKADRGLFALKK
ncbi:winged helix-turn-helix domain-containing protein [Symmachiella macrocystis]|nr:winged helix-turn-helix domain-containing protein [Symmachiella macrocystis]